MTRYILIYVILLSLVTEITLLERYRYLFSLVDSWFPYRHLCFATSLSSESILVTSADCVLNRNLSLIAIKYNPISTSELNQRFKIRSIHIHKNFNSSYRAHDNIAIIKIENTNRRYANKLFNSTNNLEFTLNDYKSGKLKSMIIFEDPTDLTNYIIVEQKLSLINYEDCLPKLVGENHWYKKSELSSSSICTHFYPDFSDLNEIDLNRTRSIIDWNHQIGSPLLLTIKNIDHLIGFLIKIDADRSSSPLVFLRISSYFYYLQKFLN